MEVGWPTDDAHRGSGSARGSGVKWTMDAQGTMRLMFDTMDAYDRADFDRLAEIYAEDAQWRNANPNGPHCRNRDDIFTMFHQHMDCRIRVGFQQDALHTHRGPGHPHGSADAGPVVSVFSFQGRRIVGVKDYPSMEAAGQRSRVQAGRRPP